VLVPYYLTALADHVVKPNSTTYIAFFLFAAGVGYAFYRIAAFKNACHAKQIGAAFAGWLAVGLIFLLLYWCDAIKSENAAATEVVPKAGLTSPPADTTH
jgi:hypothetical protein